MRHRWDPGRAFLWLWKCWDRAFRGRDLRRVRSEECGREWRGWLVGGKSSAQLGKEGPCVQGPPRGDPAGRGRLTTGPPEQRRGCRDGPKGILSVCCFLNHTPTPPLEQRVLLRPSDATMGLPSGASGRVLKDPPPRRCLFITFLQSRLYLSGCRNLSSRESPLPWPPSLLVTPKVPPKA